MEDNAPTNPPIAAAADSTTLAASATPAVTADTTAADTTQPVTAADTGGRASSRAELSAFLELEDELPANGAALRRALLGAPGSGLRFLRQGYSLVGSEAARELPEAGLLGSLLACDQKGKAGRTRCTLTRTSRSV